MKDTLALLRSIADANSSCNKRRYAALAVNGPVMVYGFNRIQYLGYRCQDCRRENIPSNTRVEHCLAIHAEQLAVIRMLKAGLRPEAVIVAGWDAEGNLIDLTLFPCTVCARVMREAGVQHLTTFNSAGEPVRRSIYDAYNEAYSLILGDANGESGRFQRPESLRLR